MQAVRGQVFGSLVERAACLVQENKTSGYTPGQCRWLPKLAVRRGAACLVWSGNLVFALDNQELPVSRNGICSVICADIYGRSCCQNPAIQIFSETGI